MHGQLAAKPGSPLFHPLQPESVLLFDGYRIEPNPIVGNLQDYSLIDLLQTDQDMVGVGMAENISRPPGW